MKSFILTIGTLLISYPLVAQTNFTGSGTNTGTPFGTSPVTGAPTPGSANFAPIPPTINNSNPVNNPVNSTGLENTGAGTGSTSFGAGTGFNTTIPPATTFPTPAGTSNLGTGTGFGTPLGTGTPTGVGTGTTQPNFGSGL